MEKKAVRVVTDILMFFSMCFLVGTGLLFNYRLVPGNRGGHGLTMLGLSRHEWGAYHLWAAYIILFLVLVHLIINYAFIKNTIASRKHWIAVVWGLSGLLITFFFLFMPIEQKGDDGIGQGRHFRGEEANKSFERDE